ncbi:DUF4037 domain-containing protein [Alloscardovia theropitheci]|uniref:DUF4037 domain-containing protein n=1 Tax=Alloscardovia theropitheci TaxID=2496842 RepID=A0A4R0QYB2_9BIFI|nr:DUF4037 domain-containing protein [Alloscardovia theropitheci]TCD54571.1 DUF4037 domain-containing protein [Alloscardovia theropitheci]
MNSHDLEQPVPSSKSQHNALGFNSGFNADDFYAGLDRIFAHALGSTQALPYLEEALAGAINSHDEFAELTVISEFLGFDRSHGRHDHAQKLAERALELRNSLGLINTEQGTIILINVATAYRQAGIYDKARQFYELAAKEAEHTLSNTDRQKAALYNNYSMLFSETGDLPSAHDQLIRALELMQLSSPDASKDGDVATTLTNIGLLELQMDDVLQAVDHTRQALDIYTNNPDLQSSAHYTSALAGYAQALFVSGNLSQALDYFEQALGLIKKFYGESSGYYETTAENVQLVRETIASQQSGSQTNGQAEQAAQDQQAQESSISATQRPDTHSRNIQNPKLSGLELSRAYWDEYADQLFSGELATLRSRAAIGLVGHGSECYGFDDDLSHDHDFGPRFCIWLTEEDFATYGKKLQERYTSLPFEFMGYSRSVSSPRGSGRDGVLSIDSFFESITGLSHAPEQAGEEHLWLNLDESTLCAATNGSVFADPFGAFSSRRQGFKNMPDDIRLYLISQRLGMISQTGQYNYARMAARKDSAAMLLCISEFAMNVSSLIFLLNNPVSVGYAPYYKWRFAALRKLSTRMGARLADLCPLLEELTMNPLNDHAQTIMNDICERIVSELNVQKLSDQTFDFLEWHRPYVESHIDSTSPLLHSI